MAPLDAERTGAYGARVSPWRHSPAVSGADVVSLGRRYRRPASGAERKRRDAFGRQWGAFSKQVSEQLRQGSES